MLPPLATLEPMKETNAALLDLLRSLAPSDWLRPTVHPRRDVKDLTAHLLDGSLRRLALQRDGFAASAPRSGEWNDLVAFIQHLNAEWMAAARRLSPRQLIEMIARADAELIEFFEGLDPAEPAMFAVSWAGEATSPNWFDLAREYTEKWHHQQQLRDATGRPGQDDARAMLPVLETFARGLPHAYRTVAAEVGAVIEIETTGAAPARWWLERGGDAWTLVTVARREPAASITLPADTTWRLWTKSVAPSVARDAATTRGADSLVAPLFAYVAMMA